MVPPRIQDEIKVMFKSLKHYLIMESKSREFAEIWYREIECQV